MSKKTLIASIITLVFVGLWMNTNFLKKTGIFCPDKYRFLSPDLNCIEDPQDETLALEKKVDAVIEKHAIKKDIKEVAVFYRDLSTRQWFGINETLNFSPGSLLKLPLAIAYYKLREIDPNIMNQEYEYTGPEEGISSLYNVQSIKPKEELVLGQVYSTSELIRRMLQYSDNEAVPLLVGAIDQNFFNKVYIDMEVYFPTTGGIEQDFLSVRTYARIFRSLYNSTYLTQESSNELLNIMTQSSFRNGIISGVPKSVKVANKFGERITLDPATQKTTGVELHDCGIIYAENPYILCVMTKGYDVEKLTRVIAEISKKIYENK